MKEFEMHDKVNKWAMGNNPIEIFDITTCDGIVVLDYWYYSVKNNHWKEGRYDNFFKSVLEWFMRNAFISPNQVYKMKKIYLIPSNWNTDRVCLPEEISLSELNGYEKDIEEIKRYGKNFNQKEIT